MINVYAIFQGQRSVDSSFINKEGKMIVGKKILYHWTNIRSDKNELLSESCEVGDAKSYKEANPIMFKRYKITCSEITKDGKIMRPSSCSRVENTVDNSLVIQDWITRYKSKMIGRSELYKNLEKFSQDDLIRYFIIVIDRSMSQ